MPVARHKRNDVPHTDPIVWELYLRLPSGDYVPAGLALVVSQRTRVDALEPHGSFAILSSLYMPVYEFVPNGAVVTGYLSDSAEHRCTWLLTRPRSLEVGRG